MPEAYDAIVISAGHDGLTGRNAARVILADLEKH